MKIISGHDYYDSALAYGQDEDLIFVRNDRTVPTDACPLVDHYPHNFVISNKRHSYWGSSSNICANGHDFVLNSVSAYIAGKHYGGIRITETAFGRNKDYDEIFWDYDKLEAFVREFDYKINVPKMEFYSFEKDVERKKMYPNLKFWMTPRNVNANELKWLMDNNVAIAINLNKVEGIDYRTRKPSPWHINCASKEYSLKAIEFAKVVDPYSMFQELSMFIGGVLPRSPNPTVEITDPKIKIAKHGFDNWSFRKMPEIK